MMMKFSTAAKTVISEVCSDIKERYNRNLKKINRFFSWSNFKTMFTKMFRASWNLGRTIGSMLRECFLSMMLDVFSGILPIVKWVVRIAVIALPVSYAVPPSYGLNDFVWPALIGSIALYMFVSFFTKVFEKMLNKEMNHKVAVSKVSSIDKNEKIKNENIILEKFEDSKNLNSDIVKEMQEINKA